MKISAVVFDIGNVLIGWTPAQFFDVKIGADRRRAFFDAVPGIHRKLQTLMDVGLSYIRLGQAATTLSKEMKAFMAKRKFRKLKTATQTLKNAWRRTREHKATRMQK